MLELIAAYRSRGHLMADTDPLQFVKDKFRSHPDLDVTTHDLTLWDLDREFNVGGFHGQQRMKLRDVLSVLRDAYCRHVGIEYTHILEPEQQQWLQERVEAHHVKPTVAQQKYILSRLNAAEAFETFLQTKYVGQKRFSLEGAESVIPMMDSIIDQAAEHQLDEVAIAMPHRGRLNVLANIVGKPYSKIFTEFEGNLNPAAAHGSGDVKYHSRRGTYIQMFGENDIKVSLTANPSHLEAVNPVLEGLVRAKQDILDKGEGGFTVLPLLLHGDAAFAGQGVVAETLNLALLRGTARAAPCTSSSTTRSLHDRAGTLAVVGVLHRRREDDRRADLPRQRRRSRSLRVGCAARRGLPREVPQGRRDRHDLLPTPRSQRGRRPVDDAAGHVRRDRHQAQRPQELHRGLIGRGDISLKEAEDALRDYQGQLERVFNEVRELEKFTPPEPSESVELDQTPPAPRLTTAVDKSVLERIGDQFANVPEGFSVHPRVKPVIEKRREMAREGHIDWAFAELLAFGSLAEQGASCAWPARTRVAARSPSVTPCSSTARPVRTTTRSRRSPRKPATAAVSWCTTRR